MTKKLTTSAMLIALSSILSLVPIFQAPYGGSVTAASMVPIIIVGFMFGTRWGLISGFVYSLLQILLGGLPAPPAQTFMMFAAVILLDYIIAFTVLGLSGMFYNLLKRKKYAIPVSALIVMLMRFMCHFISGIIIWNVYAWEGVSVPMYSLLYNGGYMLPEIIISTVVLIIMIVPIRKWANKN